MKCLVCMASFAEGSVCRQCGYDHDAPDARDADKLIRAREAFKARVTAYAPDSRVTWKDKLIPWGGLLLGMIIFLFWLRACSTMGWQVF